MCIAIFKPRNVSIKKKVLKECWISNPDGAGYMFAKDGKITIKKEVDHFEKFFQMYNRDYQNNQDCNFVLHFRIATHGRINKQNTHPFYINPTMAFCHNGILSNVHVPKESKISDTLVFRNTILKKLPDNWHNSSGIIDLLEDFLCNSKMIFLDNKGDVFILNEHLGIEDKNCWFSNDNYKVSRFEYTYSEKYPEYLTNGKVKYYSEACGYCGKILLTINEYENGYCNKCVKDEMLTKDDMKMLEANTYTDDDLPF